MREDFLTLILQAEDEYHHTLQKATANAGQYAEDCRTEQSVYIEQLKNEWRSFEKVEDDKLNKMLAEDGQKLEDATSRLKEQLKAYHGMKAELISERLKQEVLSLHGNR